MDERTNRRRTETYSNTSAELKIGCSMHLFIICSVTVQGTNYESGCLAAIFALTFDLLANSLM